MSARDEFADAIYAADKAHKNDPVDLTTHYSYVIADELIAAGYRKAERVTEYGTVINRRAAFLTPPAESLEEFKERYVYEGTWMLTERDPIITRTFLRCDPEPSEPAILPATVLHEPGADQ